MICLPFFKAHSSFCEIHPQSLTWNLKMLTSKRNFLLQELIFRWTMWNFRGVAYSLCFMFFHVSSVSKITTGKSANGFPDAPVWGCWMLNIKSWNFASSVSRSKFQIDFTKYGMGMFFFLFMKGPFHAKRGKFTLNGRENSLYWLYCIWAMLQFDPFGFNDWRCRLPSWLVKEASGLGSI